jgi:hypothetical protein
VPTVGGEEQDQPDEAEGEVGEAEHALAELAHRDADVLAERVVRVAPHEVGHLVEPEVEVALPDGLPVLLGEDPRRGLGDEGLLERRAHVVPDHAQQSHPRVEPRVLELHQVDRRPLEEPVERLARDDRRVLGLRRVEDVRPELGVGLDRVDRDRELLRIGVDGGDVLLDRVGRRGRRQLLAVERALGQAEVCLEPALHERVVGDVVEQVLDRVDDGERGAGDVVAEVRHVSPPPAGR